METGECEVPFTAADSDLLTQPGAPIDAERRRAALVMRASPYSFGSLAAPLAMLDYQPGDRGVTVAPGQFSQNWGGRSER